MTNDYVQSTDLSVLIQGLEISATGAMDSNDADSVIQIIEGEVNGIIASLGFTVPITLSASPHAYKFVRSIVVQGVMALIQSDIHALTDDTEGSREQAFWRRYEMAIKRLEDGGGAQLIDAVADATEPGNYTPAIGDQTDNVDRFLDMRTMTTLRQNDNEFAASRLLRGRGRSRYFKGGVQQTGVYFP